jgi:hypothetical protein
MMSLSQQVAQGISGESSPGSPSGDAGAVCISAGGLVDARCRTISTTPVRMIAAATIVRGVTGSDASAHPRKTATTGFT